MDTSRRGFLKLLGLGGAAVAVGGPSLFSSGGDLLIGGADHFVFDVSNHKARLTPGGTAHFLWKNDDVHTEYHQATQILLRNPKRDRVAYRSRSGKMVPAKAAPPWSPSGEPSTYQVNCPVPEGEDPHIAFFMAADELRRRIDSDVQEFAKTLKRYSLVMITEVHVPIMAFPHPESGFYLETQISQYAAKASDIENRSQAASAHGEVPIETPNGIDFKYMMLMQEELRGMGMLANAAPVRKRQAREAFRRSMGSLRA